MKGQRKEMKNSSLLLTAACAASAVFFCAGWTPQAQDETRTIDTIRGDAIFENPPIAIDAVNFLGMWAFCVYNKSERRIFCTLRVTSRSMGDANFWVDAEDSTDVGNGLLYAVYRTGDRGYIKVEGYKRKLYFRLTNNGYSTDFGW